MRIELARAGEGPTVFGRSGAPTAMPTHAAHIIVCGNEKGGSGKSTLAVHLTTALLGMGCKVASIDLDARQLTMTRYLENRRRTSLRVGPSVAMPHHICMDASPLPDRAAAERHEREELSRALADLSPAHDFVVIDTPGFDTNLSRAAHGNADTLLTPMNDSFIDYDVLARIDPEDGSVSNPSQYALRVREARRLRLSRAARMLDWTIVRNRLSSIASNNERQVHERLRLLGMELGFRLVDGVAERVVFRDLFHFGLTVMDDVRAATEVGAEIAPRRVDSWLRARKDIETLVYSLNLPTDAMRSARNEAREAWLANLARPTDLPQAYAG